MESRSVKELKAACKSTYDFLVLRRNALESAGKLEAVKDELYDDMEAVINIYHSVNEENLGAKNRELVELQDKIEAKGLYVPMDERTAEPETKPETTAVTEVGESKSCAGRVFAWLVSIGILTGIAYHTGVLINKEPEYETIEDDDYGTVSDKFTKQFDRPAVTPETTAAPEAKVTEKAVVKAKTTATPKVTATAKVTEKPKATSAPTVAPTAVTPLSTLVLGEYGTFFDVTDNEQVMARAQYIYDNYFAPIIDQLSPNETVNVTVFKIANTIRVMNAELPLDENGNKVLDGVTVDTYGNYFLDYTTNIPSSKQLGAYYHIPAYLFAVDGSEVQEFIKSYDTIYDKMVLGLNVGDDEEVQDAIACIGYKFWNEWYLMGADGSMNPHNLSPDLKYFAYQATVAPYSTTALESDLNQKRPVCIMSCIDYETKEQQALTVTSIFEALNSGAWNQVSARLAGMEGKNIAWLPLFWQSLDDQLNWKYSHLQTLKRN